MSGAVEQAYNAIRADIIAGRIGVGAHITAGPIAKQLGISRTPVREALRRLDAEGLVVLVANRGAHVQGTNWNEIKEIFDLRILLEGYAAELSAQSMTDEAIANLAELNREMQDLAAQREDQYLLKIREKNAAFHRLIIEGAQNRRLSALIGAVVEGHLVLQTYQNFSDRDLARSMESHEELVEAISARNGAWAGSVMRSHLYGAKQVMVHNRDARQSFAEESKRHGSSRRKASV